jgi:predicted HicB family RNase H-like nuclease
MRKKDKTFTMRIPTDIHNYLEKYATENYTSMSNVIVQLILKLKKEFEIDEK